MGLIYVNPEGPEGKPDPVASFMGISFNIKALCCNSTGEGCAP